MRYMPKSFDRLDSAGAVASMLGMSRQIRNLALIGIVGGVWFCTSRAAFAKERHLEQLRVVLISRAARCATCHVSDHKKDWENAGLNLYGQRLHEISPGDSLGDRILMIEHGPTSSDNEEDRAKREKDQDIDGDGVPNWVEILAKSNPGDAKIKPPKGRVDRVKRVINCTICHTDTNLPGKQGLEANPHNAYGDLLSQTTDPKDVNANTPKAERQRKAESIPILKRIDMTKRRKPKGSKATYWEKLRLMRLPADDEDNPSAKSLKTFRKWAAEQRSKKKRDPTRGTADPAHEDEGFMQDAKHLD